MTSTTRLEFPDTRRTRSGEEPGSAPITGSSGNSGSTRRHLTGSSPEQLEAQEGTVGGPGSRIRSRYGSSEFGAVLPQPRADDPVGHGYTAFQVVRLAVWAARECHWVNGMAMTDRAETAWEAITEHLRLVDRRPEETELVAIGWKAMKAQHYQDLKTHGLGGKDKALVSRAFVRYWTSASSPVHSYEDLVVDRLALAQIWIALTPAHRLVLSALAEYQDRRRAEQAVNMDSEAFTRALRRARRAFFVLWHEGETPSRMWGYDRPGARHQNVMYLVRLRKQRALKRKAAGTVSHRGHRSPKDLGCPTGSCWPASSPGRRTRLWPESSVSAGNSSGTG